MEILHDKNNSTFSVNIDGKTARLIYRITDGSLDILSTFVPDEMRGMGIAGKLTKDAYDFAKSENLKCKATCSFAVRWLEKHPEYMS